MNRTERLDHLVGLLGVSYGPIRRDLSSIIKLLSKKWNLDKKCNLVRRFGNSELDMKAMEMRLLLKYYYIEESSLLKIDWRKFKKVVLKDFGRDYMDCFNTPKLIKNYPLTDEMVDSFFAVSADNFEREYHNDWIAPNKG
ncbi:hypothetical protein TOTORO_00960 [Serratia phage vB_SmaS-Totoro]|nr:hypothetical protein TOTORO_00960 [Serratia phage vB_SmaS-Totoro]